MRTAHPTAARTRSTAIGTRETAGVRKGGASMTAQYVATVRAVLTDRGELEDPHAAAMLVPSMRGVRRALSLPGLRRLTTGPFFAGLAARIAWFDAEVERALDDGIPQVVVVGAGYDSRAWRLAQEGAHWFEIDHPATQADKRRRAPVGQGPTYVAADLEVTTVADALAGTGFDAARRALWVIEGVTMYLADAQVRDLLSHLAATAARGSRLAVNFAAPPRSDRGFARVRQPLVRLSGRASGEAHRSFADVPRAAALVGGCGWQVDEASALRDVAARLLPSTTRLRVDRMHAHSAAVAASTPARAGWGGRGGP